MTLNILFFTVTIKKRKETMVQSHHNYEMMKKIEEENRNRQAYMPRIY